MIAGDLSGIISLSRVDWDTIGIWLDKNDDDKDMVMEERMKMDCKIRYANIREVGNSWEKTVFDVLFVFVV